MTDQWHMSPMVPFDLETDAQNPKEARPVTGYAAVVHADKSAERHLWGATEWLIDPGVEIPEDASKIHGVTTEHAREHGADRVDGVRSIIRRLVELITNDGTQLGLKLEGEWDTADSLQELVADLSYQTATTWPIVGQNLSYDFTVLHRDARRNGVRPFEWICQALRLNVPVIDVYVLDKKIDRFRKGFRRLENLCEVYKVRHGTAHEASSDALAAARIAVRMGSITPWIANLDVMDLHRRQVEWRREQCVNLQAYFRRSGKPDAVVDPCWPVCLPESHPEETEPEVGLFDA